LSCLSAVRLQLRQQQYNAAQSRASVPQTHRIQLQCSPHPAGWQQLFRNLDASTLTNELMYPLGENTTLPGLVKHDSIPDDVEFSQGADGLCTRCRYTGRLGDDRCVVAKDALPDFGKATILAEAEIGSLPEDWQWSIACRCCAYYELAISDVHDALRTSSRPRRFQELRPCVSVGLANADLLPRNVLRQQCGWNRCSWALHGDDGQVYSGSGHGHRLLSLLPLRGTEAPDAMNSPTFGAGDVVGCGVASFEHGLAAEVRGIFFTLNGRLLGVTYFLDPNVGKLWPCVGIDANWSLEFNFGRHPFRFDLSTIDGAFSFPSRAVFRSLHSSSSRSSISSEESILESDEESSDAHTTDLDMAPGVTEMTPRSRRRGSQR